MNDRPVSLNRKNLSQYVIKPRSIAITDLSIYLANNIQPNKTKHTKTALTHYKNLSKLLNLDAAQLLMF